MSGRAGGSVQFCAALTPGGRGSTLPALRWEKARRVGDWTELSQDTSRAWAAKVDIRAPDGIGDRRISDDQQAFYLRVRTTGSQFR